MWAVYSRSNWNLEVLVFLKGGKPEKNPPSKDENQQQTQPTYDTESCRFEPGHIGWRASALTTAPSLLPYLRGFTLEANANLAHRNNLFLNENR